MDSTPVGSFLTVGRAATAGLPLLPVGDERISPLARMALWKISGCDFYLPGARVVLASETPGLQTALVQTNEALMTVGKPVLLLKNIQPANATEEAEKFFAALEHGRAYNPQFEYQPSTFEVGKVREQLEGLHLDALYAQYGPPMLPILSFVDELYDTLNLIEARSTADFARWSVESYGVPADGLLKRATALLEQTPSPDSEEAVVSATEMKERLEHRLHQYGLTHWTVSFRDAAAARVSVSANEQTVWLLSTARFSSKDLERLLAHEIDTHVLRAENGARQPYYQVLATGLRNYIETEEGLATLNERLTETLDLATLRAYALRTVAVAWAHRASFFETYQQVVQYEEPAKAYDVTVRVKRGLGDTAQSGAFTKDYLYFSGGEKLQEYYQTQHYLSLLYVGKVGIQDLEYLSPLIAEGLIVPPAYLPDYHKKARD